MKTLKLVCCLVVALIITSGLVSVHGKRQKPRHDEIERVINDTHSVIWKCSNSECPPGSGLSVQCGSSIPVSTPITCVPCVKGVNTSSTQDYSTCRSCRNCGKHELWTGECTPEEDTIKCLGTCDKGFYKSKISEDCHQCSYCCGEDAKHHEEQCEDSGLPSSKQCRQTGFKCYPPTEADRERQDHQPENQGGLRASEIAAIAVGFVIFVIIVIALTVVIWRYDSWQEVKSCLKKWCCFCCNPMFSRNGERTIHFDENGHEYQDQDLESTSCTKANGSRLNEEAKIQDATVGTSNTVRKPVYQRLLSAPAEKTRPDTRSNSMPRSHSHPGCLKDLDKPKQTSDLKCGLKKLFSSPRIKKGYTRVPTEIPMIDYLPSMNVAKDSLPVQPAAVGHGELPQIRLQSVDVGIQNADKERLERPPVQDQGTSTTELHLLPAETLQFACIPQAFRTRLLSETMSAIPITFYRKICMKLDTFRRLSWNDFRLLAEKVGLDKDNIWWLEQSDNPTKLILQEFESQKDPSIGRFKAILEEMERNDVVTVIEDWVVEKWREKSNLSSSYSGKGPNNKLYSLV